MESIQIRHQAIARVPPATAVILGNNRFREVESLWAGLSQETRALLERLAHRPRILHCGQKLFIAGDISNSLYLINSGSFKAYIDLINGEEQITGFHFANDVLGFDGLEDEQHTYTVESLETSSVCRLPFRTLEVLSRADHRLYRGLMKKFSRQINHKHMTILMLGRMNAEQKLAHFFLRMRSLMEECGRISDRINLSMSRHDIANYLGLAPETVCRLLNRFQNLGLLKVDNRQVQLLDTEGLHCALRQGVQKIPRADTGKQ